MDYSTKTLAKGCFGKVYKEKFSDSWAAVKKVPMGLITREQLERECKVYYSVNHNNVVKLLGDPYMRDGKWHIPLEFIFGEDLETAIFSVQKSKIQLSPSVKATIITGMCEGLFHLHSKNIVHQDLKPDNIMVEHETHRAVIIDMGLAKFSMNGLSSAQNLGNEAYSAPEILQLYGVRDKRSDVWAMGKIIAELCARVRLPTNSVSETKIRETLKDNPYSNPVAKMVVTSPTTRATMAGVIEEIRRAGKLLGAEVGARLRTKPDITNPGLAVPGVGRGALAINPRPKMMGHPPTPFPPEARLHEPAVVHRNPSPRREPVVPFANAQMAAQFSTMSIPCTLPKDGTVIRRRYDEDHQEVEYKEIVTRNGRVVKYDDVKITKP